MILMFCFFILGQNIDLGSLMDYSNLFNLLGRDVEFSFFSRLEQILYIHRTVFNDRQYENKFFSR